jgi:hypothetical protein
VAPLAPPEAWVFGGGARDLDGEDEVNAILKAVEVVARGMTPMTPPTRHPGGGVQIRCGRADPPLDVANSRLRLPGVRRTSHNAGSPPWR